MIRRMHMFFPLGMYSPVNLVNPVNPVKIVFNEPNTVLDFLQDEHDSQDAHDFSPLECIILACHALRDKSC